MEVEAVEAEAVEAEAEAAGRRRSRGRGAVPTTSIPVCERTKSRMLERTGSSARRP